MRGGAGRADHRTGHAGAIGPARAASAAHAGWCGEGAGVRHDARTGARQDGAIRARAGQGGFGVCSPSRPAIDVSVLPQVAGVPGQGRLLPGWVLIASYDRASLGSDVDEPRLPQPVHTLSLSWQKRVWLAGCWVGQSRSWCGFRIRLPRSAPRACRLAISHPLRYMTSVNFGIDTISTSRRGAGNG